MLYHLTMSSKKVATTTSKSSTADFTTDKSSTGKSSTSKSSTDKPKGPGKDTVYYSPPAGESPRSESKR
ncbi:hypothetical protein CHU98_g9272 [Xylaria longipes]|nr:hypothetical protein CHU98_g9272 [Xylaria longipes]